MFFFPLGRLLDSHFGLELGNVSIGRGGGCVGFFYFWNVTNVPFCSFSLGTTRGLTFRPGTRKGKYWERGALFFFYFWNVTNVPFCSFSLGTTRGLTFRPGTRKCKYWERGAWFFFIFGTLLMFLFVLFL